MKCVKRNGVVVRVPDTKAYELVKNDEFVFTTKKEWKANGRRYGKGTFPQFLPFDKEEGK